MISAQEALERLREGNRRFATDSGDPGAYTHAAKRDAGVEQQRPIAIILGCSDARVPAEIVFDQGVGDLFVVRVAGNIAAPSQVGSIEYAAVNTGARLVVVLGHSHCGAVTATLEHVLSPAGVTSPNLQTIIERIEPAISPILASADNPDKEASLSAAVRANIGATVEQLRRDSKILGRLAEADGLVIVGAEYSLETGLVEFLGPKAN